MCETVSPSRYDAPLNIAPQQCNIYALRHILDCLWVLVTPIEIAADVDLMSHFPPAIAPSSILQNKYMLLVVISDVTSIDFTFQYSTFSHGKTLCHSFNVDRRVIIRCDISFTQRPHHHHLVCVVQCACW